MTKKKSKAVITTLALRASSGLNGLPIPEFCALVDIATNRYGKDVMMSAMDEKGHAHLTKEGEHLGYIDINTGSLVWDKASPGA